MNLFAKQKDTDLQNKLAVAGTVREFRKDMYTMLDLKYICL